MSAENNLLQAIEIMIKRMLPSQNLLIASVVSPPPELKIKFSEQIIPPEMIYCSNYLLPDYRRDYRFEGIIDEMHQDVSKFKNNYSSSDMSLMGQGPHKHQLISSQGSGSIDSTGDYKHHGQMWWTNTLEVGDEVVVAVIGQCYVVLDRIVQMPNSAIEEGA